MTGEISQKVFQSVYFNGPSEVICYKYLLSLRLTMKNSEWETLSIFTEAWTDEPDDPIETSPNGRFKRYREEIECVLHKKAFKAYDAQTGREVEWNVVALERLSIDQRKAVVQRLRLLKRLEHPAVMSCIDFWVEASRKELVYVNQIVVRSTLRHHLNKIQRPKLKIIKGWCKDILAGIACLHSQPQLTSQILKIGCNSIFINANENKVKLGIDCLLLPILHPTCPGPSPPQTASGISTPSCSIYSFGMTLLQICTLKPPYSHSHNQQHLQKLTQQGVVPPELEQIGNVDVRATIELCIGVDASRPTVQELMGFELWRGNEAVDRLPVRMERNSVMTKKSMGSTKADSVRSVVKKVAENVDRVDTEAETVFSWVWEDRVYEIKVPKPKAQKPQTFQKFLTALSQRFQDKQDLAQNHPAFQPDLFKAPKTCKNLSNIIIQQPDLTYIDTLNSARTAFARLYENYRLAVAQPNSEQVVEQRLSMERKQLERLQRGDRERLNSKKIQNIDILGLEYPAEAEDWHRGHVSRNTMNTDELMTFNCSSILQARDYMLAAEFSGIQRQVDLLDRNEEKDLDASFIDFLTPHEDQEEERRAGPEPKLPTVAEEAPPDSLNRVLCPP